MPSITIITSPATARYETIDYPDWDVPYTREFDLGGTRTIYNGVMVGKYRHYVADALTQSIDSILAQSAVHAGQDSKVDMLTQVSLWAVLRVNVIM